uniref:Uncharacterized protein n=1 Tax=Anguilla anguilla TaxID=7936 RepID=A0A0E9QMG8_ANGAN
MHKAFKTVKQNSLHG